MNANSSLPPKRQRPKLGIRTEQREYPAHRAFVRSFVCVIHDKHECEGIIEAAHVRIGTEGGTGLKPHDKWCIPACSKAHQEQHQIGERSFAAKYGIDLKAVAEKFSKASPHRSKWEDE